MGNLSSNGNVSLMGLGFRVLFKSRIVASEYFQLFAFAMASSHAMESLAARWRVAVAASKLSSTDVAAITVLSGSESSYLIFVLEFFFPLIFLSKILINS